MHIKRILSQHRRDFYATFECEHCGHTYENRGYDDKHFHEQVIPNFECPKCGKKASADYVPQQTKYHEGYQI